MLDSLWDSFQLYICCPEKHVDPVALNQQDLPFYSSQLFEDDTEYKLNSVYMRTLQTYTSWTVFKNKNNKKPWDFFLICGSFSFNT